MDALREEYRKKDVQNTAFFYLCHWMDKGKRLESIPTAQEVDNITIAMKKLNFTLLDGCDLPIIERYQAELKKQLSQAQAIISYKSYKSGKDKKK